MDVIQRFVFDELDARGAIVRLQESCEAIQATHHYPPPLATLLNQFAVAACLLRDSLKVKAAVTIQLRASGAIALIMADCSANNKVRAIAEYDLEQLPVGEFLDLRSVAGNAVMAITISPVEGERYQGIVPIEHPALAACLEDYFQRSEQLPTWFSLLADQSQAVGMSIHALPSEKVKNREEADEHFLRLQTLLKSMTPGEALQLDNQATLTRLFHEESCRLFSPSTVEFGCECSREKSLAAIISLGKEDAEQLIAEQQHEGLIAFKVDCHFCFQRYEIPHAQVSQAFEKRQ